MFLGFILGIGFTLIVVGLLYFSETILACNRKMPWYNWYCYLKAMNYTKEQQQRTYRGGFITEKQFRKLAKNKFSSEEVENIIRKHNNIMEYLKQHK
jgi:hypothetical protein